jgi:murein DD-endopeptidase MepM/ murein hydrolase activator NlpD
MGRRNERSGSNHDERREKGGHLDTSRKGSNVKSGGASRSRRVTNARNPEGEIARNQGLNELKKRIKNDKSLDTGRRGRIRTNGTGSRIRRAATAGSRFARSAESSLGEGNSRENANGERQSSEAGSAETAIRYSHRIVSVPLRGLSRSAARGGNAKHGHGLRAEESAYNPDSLSSKKQFKKSKQAKGVTRKDSMHRSDMKQITIRGGAHGEMAKRIRVKTNAAFPAAARDKLKKNIYIGQMTGQRLSRKYTSRRINPLRKGVRGVQKALLGGLKFFSRLRIIMFIAGGFIGILMVVALIIAAMASTPFGVFFSNDGAPGSLTIPAVVREYQGAWQDKIDGYKEGYDEWEIVLDPSFPDSPTGLDWTEILSIYAGRLANNYGDMIDFSLIDESKKQIMWDVIIAMYPVTTTTSSREVTVETGDVDPDTGDPVTETQTITKVHITVKKNPVQTMIDYYELDSVNSGVIGEMLSGKYGGEWNQLLYQNSDSNYNGGTGEFAWPCTGFITSGFQKNRVNPVTGKIQDHNGIDIAPGGGAAALGTPIYAAKEGTVTFAGWNAGGYGNLVIINHGDGKETRYAHNLGFASGIAYGTYVERGQVIAFMGSTGNSTGAHCHFELRINGTAVNPLDYLQTDMGRVLS